MQRWNIVTQYGTHIDAPIHFVENKRYLEDIDLKELVLPLIVLDFSTEVANNNDFIVTREHLEAWEKSMVLLNLALLLHFVPIGQNVGLILKRLKTKMRTDNNTGWGLDALKYLIEERRVEAVGHETFDTDASVDVVKMVI